MRADISFDILKAEYIPQICEIEKEAFLSPWSAKSFEGEPYNTAAHYVIALANGRVAGYGGFWRILDEGHITNIAVERSFRGQGVGKDILEQMIKRAAVQKIERMTLEVRVSNITAIKLYEKFGFVTLGVRPKYYENGEDALIMWMEGAHADGI